MIVENEATECVKLHERAFSVKKRFLGMYRKAHAGHVGSSLSCAEILVFLQFAWMGERDTLVLSKGHAAAALYSLFAETGALSLGEIASFYEDGTQLSALTPFNAFETIPFATGSLGYGLSVSAGMALGERFRGAHGKSQDRRFFCVTSDGELNEGSVWEAALFIAHHNLTSVVWIIDRNRIQATGRTEDVMALEPIDAKLCAFGYHVVGVDGHDFVSLLKARDECADVLAARTRPVAIIANTIKGHGVSYMQDTIDCHYLPMSDTQYERALLELAQTHEALLNGYRNAD